jgi:hypothetical protein
LARSGKGRGREIFLFFGNLLSFALTGLEKGPTMKSRKGGLFLWI